MSQPTTQPSSPSTLEGPLTREELIADLNLGDNLAAIIRMEGDELPEFAIVDIPEEYRFQGISRILILGVEQRFVQSETGDNFVQIDLFPDTVISETIRISQFETQKPPARYATSWSKVIIENKVRFIADLFDFEFSDNYPIPVRKTEANTAVTLVNDKQVEKLQSMVFQSRGSETFHPQNVTLVIIPGTQLKDFELHRPDKSMLLIVDGDSFETVTAQRE